MEPIPSRRVMMTVAVTRLMIRHPARRPILIATTAVGTFLLALVASGYISAAVTLSGFPTTPSSCWGNAAVLSYAGWSSPSALGLDSDRGEAFVIVSAGPVAWGHSTPLGVDVLPARLWCIREGRPSGFSVSSGVVPDAWRPPDGNVNLALIANIPWLFVGALAGFVVLAAVAPHRIGFPLAWSGMAFAILWLIVVIGYHLIPQVAMAFLCGDTRPCPAAQIEWRMPLVWALLGVATVGAGSWWRVHRPRRPSIE